MAKVLIGNIKGPQGIQGVCGPKGEPGEVGANAGGHNSVFRGINLLSKYSLADIYAKIAAGTFEDLYIGDYFDITITASGYAQETVRCLIAGFDCYLYNGDTALTKHHAVIVPQNSFKTPAKMNETNTSEGGYAGSVLHTTEIPKYDEALGTVFGAHLLMHRALLTNKISATGNSMAGAGFTGYASGWAWSDCKARLMTEIELYGSTVWSSSGYDTGTGKSQLPLFSLAPEYIRAGLGGTSHSGRDTFWLSAVASATYFAYCNVSGLAYYLSASSGLGVRPLFLIG